jgi:hypothetical protein
MASCHPTGGRQGPPRVGGLWRPRGGVRRAPPRRHWVVTAPRGEVKAPAEAHKGGRPLQTAVTGGSHHDEAVSQDESDVRGSVPRPIPLRCGFGKTSHRLANPSGRRACLGQGAQASPLHPERGWATSQAVHSPPVPAGRVGGGAAGQAASRPEAVAGTRSSSTSIERFAATHQHVSDDRWSTRRHPARTHEPRSSRISFGTRGSMYGSVNTTTVPKP